jgi:1-acyl-sn-glycerol-3-phosphate acyltransferase
MLWMLVTVVPWALFLVLASLFVRGDPVYWIGAGWLRASVLGARYILGIRTHVTGMENLPVGKKSPAILLVSPPSKRC